MNRIRYVAAILSVLMVATLSFGQVSPVMLLLSFGPSPEAEDLERAFRFGANRPERKFSVDFAFCSSVFEAASVATRAMENDTTLLIVFAGDEGTAVALSLLSREYEIPVLKLTSEPRSFTHLSRWLYEFLPSLEAQGEALGEFAVRECGRSAGFGLVCEDESGAALARGFEAGFERSKGEFVRTLRYPNGAVKLTSQMNELYEAQASRAHQDDHEAALDIEEQEAVFGDSAEGEFLAPDEREADGSARKAAHADAIFFALTSDHIDGYAAQIRKLSRDTGLFGNSGWLNPDALTRNRRITGGMHIAVPLTPTTLATNTDLVHAYRDHTDVAASEWELLGLDAAEYIGRIMAGSPETRSDVVRLLNELDRFEGSAVQVDFRYGRENRGVRVLKFDGDDLTVVR